ncbi:MAG TPA: tripartite tricarboxylate transporter substrate binding protein [Burkholderiaceae bacterium]
MAIRNFGKIVLHTLGAAVLGLATAGFSAAYAAFPTGPITIIVPFGAGGSTDQIGRLIANHFQKDFKVPVIVENKPGANATIGNSFVARSKPDGQTLLIGGTDMTASQFLYKNLPYDPETAFTPIGIVAEFPFLMLIDKRRGITSVAQYVDYAQKNPDKSSFSSAGIGNSTHLAGEMFKKATKLDALVHVPFNASPQALNAVISGQVDYAFDPAISSIALVTGGKANALAVVADRRLTALPNVPTMSELGYKDFDRLSPWSWKGLFAPAGTPQEVLDMLQKSLARLLQDPAFIQQIEKTASLVVPPKSTTASQEFLTNQRKGWGALIRELHIEQQ